MYYNQFRPTKYYRLQRHVCPWCIFTYNKCTVNNIRHLYNIYITYCPLHINLTNNTDLNRSFANTAIPHTKFTVHCSFSYFVVVKNGTRVSNWRALNQAVPLKMVPGRIVLPRVLFDVVLHVRGQVARAEIREPVERAADERSLVRARF
jgi:hypothetical protein